MIDVTSFLAIAVFGAGPRSLDALIGRRRTGASVAPAEKEPATV